MKKLLILLLIAGCASVPSKPIVTTDYQTGKVYTRDSKTNPRDYWAWEHIYASDREKVLEQMLQIPELTDCEIVTLMHKIKEEKHNEEFCFLQYLNAY